MACLDDRPEHCISNEHEAEATLGQHCLSALDLRSVLDLQFEGFTHLIGSHPMTMHKPQVLSLKVAERMMRYG